MIALLTLSAALAEPCVGGYAVGTVPAPQAEDVPVDVVLAAALYADCGSVPLGWRMQLLLDGAVVHDDLVGFEGETRIESRPAEPLAPNTRYELHVLPEGGGAETIAAFTTGASEAVALSGVPAASVVSANYSPDSDTLRVDARVEPIEDPYSLVGLALEPGGPAFLTGDGATAALNGPVQLEQAPDEACVVPVQWGADGVRIEGEEACGRVAIQRSPGRACAASASASSFWPLALLLLGRRRPWSSSSR
jgi:hypothetical protein